VDYTKHLSTLIQRAKTRELPTGEYKERHHIILRAEGGTNSKDNIVELTAREHFVAHWLLFREKPNSFVRAEAFRMMCNIDPSLGKHRYVRGSRAVAEAREASARLKSELYRLRCWVTRDGEKKYIFKQVLELYLEVGWTRGKNYSPSEETREKIRQSRLNEPPRGKEHRDKMSRIIKERYITNPELWKKSKETREKLSIIVSKRWESEEHRKKFRETRKQSKVKCPYCTKVGNYNIMQRWHFKNCKTLIQ